jgi:hypothetical protein
MGATISMTYDRVTPESAEAGDVAEAGFCAEGGWYFDAASPAVAEELTTHPELYWKPVNPGDLSSAIRWAQDHGCTQDNGDGSFYSVEPYINYETGEDTSHAVHFNGFTPSTLARIARAICN